jgi:hypothetical protein
MTSHTYEFNLADLGRLTGGLLGALVSFAVIMRLAAAAGILPWPRPNFDVDQTILIHQAEASRSTSAADWLFIGDSSCLMDFSGSQLEELARGRHRVINLGTLSYLGFNGYAALLSRYAAANPGNPRLVVVLVHPEMLRGISPVPEYLRMLSNYYAGVDQGDSSTVQGQLCGVFGLDIFRNRFLSRVPLPLPKLYGRYYGFNRDLDAYMNRHRGSAVDPGRYGREPGQGNAEYRLSANWHDACLALRAAVPSSAKLVVGITPVPASFAPRDYAVRWQEMLDQWAGWMGADARLSELPPTLPDSFFASTTHLNEDGARRYTVILANCLDHSTP